MDSGSQRITFFELLLVKPRKLLIFAPLNGKIPCGCGVIGSRARLRIWCREACRCESYHPHVFCINDEDKQLKASENTSQRFFYDIIKERFKNRLYLCQIIKDFKIQYQSYHEPPKTFAFILSVLAGGMSFFCQSKALCHQFCP